MIGRATGRALLLMLVAAGAGCAATGTAGEADDVTATDTTASEQTEETVSTTVPSDPSVNEATASDTSEAGAVTITTERDPTGGPDDGEALTLEGAELEAHVAERYEAFWDAYDDARAAPSADPSTDFPILADLAAGEQLEASHDAITQLAELGEAIREPDTPAISGTGADAEHRVRIDLIEDSVAEVSACVVNDDVRYHVGTGAVVRDGVSTVTSTATMAINDGQWKLIRSRAVDIADGITGCWLAPDDEYPH